MAVSSQEPRGTGLSASLVSDFRAILDALEKEKAARAAPSIPTASSFSHAPSLSAAEDHELRPQAKVGAAAAADAVVDVDTSGARTDAPAPAAGERPTLAPRAAAPARPAPLPYSEVRSRISALGDVRGMYPGRSAGPDSAGSAGSSSVAKEASAQPAASQAQPASRRRAFGSAVRAEAEPVGRRRKAASKDVITWKRLAALALCVAVAGSGLVALQRVVGREEAKVAPEAIGNAAIASVAPAMPVAVPPPPAAAPAPPVLAAASPSADAAAPPSVAAVVADIPKLNLRDAEPVFEAPAAKAVAPAGLTAFAASDPADLPKSAPLPPRAPAKQAALGVPQKGSADKADESADAETVADDSPDAADGSAGGDPVGPVLVRTSVTMRAAAKRGSPAVANLQAGQKVELVSCKGWCEIIADGKRGFVYRSFLDSQSVRQAEAATQ